MYYSITFDNEVNTWGDWRLIPSSPPMIEPPEAYQNFVDIPGRKEGPLDLSDVLTSGEPSYNNSKGSWDFLRGDLDQNDRKTLYEAIRHKLHNRRCRVSFEEDPDHYYFGRFTVKEMKTGRNGLGITIEYIIPPIRYGNDNTIDPNYP